MTGHAYFVCEVTVTDPDTHGKVELSVYKDIASGGMFALDNSYLLTVSDDKPVIEPFNGKQVVLIDGPFGHSNPGA